MEDLNISARRKYFKFIFTLIFSVELWFVYWLDLLLQIAITFLSFKIEISANIYLQIGKPLNIKLKFCISI